MAKARESKTDYSICRVCRYEPEKHFFHLKQWWQENNHKVVNANVLPNVGFVATLDEKPVAALFADYTVSGMGIIDYLVVSKDIRRKRRNDIIDLLSNYVRQFLTSLKCKYIIMMATPIAERHAKRNGYGYHHKTTLWEAPLWAE